MFSCSTTQLLYSTSIDLLRMIQLTHLINLNWFRKYTTDGHLNDQYEVQKRIVNKNIHIEKVAYCNNLIVQLLGTFIILWNLDHKIQGTLGFK